MKRILLTCLAVMLLYAAPMSAQTYPDPESTSVNDFAGLMSDEAKASVKSALDQLQADTGVVMTLVTLSRKETFAPDQDAEQFARGLFDQWQIGDSDRNDGVLFLVLHSDREVRIQLGEAYGGDWQLATMIVLRRSILPAFRQDNYEEGIVTGVNDTIENIVKPYLEGANAPKAEPDATTAPDAGKTEDSGGVSGWWGAAIFAPIALLIGWGVLKSKLAKCPQCGNRGLNVTNKRLQEPTETAPGQGERITECGKCGHRSVEPYTIAAKGKAEDKDARKDDSPPDMGGGKSGDGGAGGKW